jgi:hypothetical protein
VSDERIFEAWAPDGALWTPWAKPVLFANLSRFSVTVPSVESWRAVDVSQIPSARSGTAIVVELPGIDSVLAGLALANEGYRPVPLFNVNVGPNAVVDVDAIAGALRVGADAMGEMRIAPDAPPAFLLDANRMRPAKMIGPGKFDNRWIVMPQDFPSATMLMSRGIKEALVIVSGDNPARGDLAHVLLRWRRAGLPILALDLKSSERPREMRIEPPSLFRRAWYRFIALAGLRRSNVGGFGAQIPEEYEDGGGVGGFS